MFIYINNSLFLAHLISFNKMEVLQSNNAIKYAKTKPIQQKSQFTNIINYISLNSLAMKVIKKIKLSKSYLK